MEMIPVISSNLKSVGWKGNVILENGYKAYDILRIEFLHGGIYDYLNVNKEIYEAMMKEESKGSFWYRKIKGKYTELRVK